MRKLRFKIAQAMPHVWYWKIRNKAFRSKVVSTPLHFYYSKKRRSSRSSPEPKYLKRGGEASINGDTPRSSPFTLQDDDAEELSSMRKRTLLLREILEEDKPCISPFLSSSRRYEHHSSREDREGLVNLKESSIMHEEDKACISPFLSRREDQHSSRQFEEVELHSYEDCRQRTLPGECCVTSSTSSLKTLAKARYSHNQLDLLELQCKLKSLLKVSDELNSTVCDATPPSIVLPSTPASSVQFSGCQNYVVVNNQHNSPALKPVSSEIKSIRACPTSSSSSTDSTRHIISSSSDAGLSSSAWERDFSSLASTVSGKLQDKKSIALDETIAMKVNELKEKFTSKEVLTKTKSKDISPDCSGGWRLTSLMHKDERHDGAFIKHTLPPSDGDDAVSCQRCSPPASVLSHRIMNYDGYSDCHESELDSASKSFKKLHRTAKPRKQLDFSKETIAINESSHQNLATKTDHLEYIGYDFPGELHKPYQRSTSRADTFHNVCSSPDSSTQRRNHAATPKKHSKTVSTHKPGQRRRGCQDENAFQALLGTQRTQRDSRGLQNVQRSHGYQDEDALEAFLSAQRSHGLESVSTIGHVPRDHGYVDVDTVDSRRLNSSSFRCGFDSSSHSLPYDLEYTGYDHHWELDYSKDDPPLLRSLSRRSPMASDRRSGMNHESGRKLSHGCKKKNNNTDDDERYNSRRDKSPVYDNNGAATTVAMVKCSQDPRKDFKESMMEMISERGIGHHDSVELVELLRCYLSLNSRRYHDTIVGVFVDLWSQLSS